MRSYENSSQEQGWKIHMLMKIAIGAVALIIVGLVFLGFYRMIFLKFADNYELAYEYDISAGGKIKILEGTGYFRTIPFIRRVHTIDLRPMRVCNNANKRQLNCKLVQFNPAGLEEFLRWHGRNNYGNDGDVGGEGNLHNILLSYALDCDSSRYPFLKILPGGSAQ